MVVDGSVCTPLPEYELENSRSCVEVALLPVRSDLALSSATEHNLEGESGLRAIPATSLL